MNISLLHFHFHFSMLSSVPSVFGTGADVEKIVCAYKEALTAQRAMLVIAVPCLWLAVHLFSRLGLFWMPPLASGSLASFDSFILTTMLSPHTPSAFPFHSHVFPPSFPPFLLPPQGNNKKPDSGKLQDVLKPTASAMVATRHIMQLVANVHSVCSITTTSRDVFLPY